MEIKTKKESIDLYEKGFFGNKGLNWYSFEDYLKSNYNGKIVIRERKKFGKGVLLYDLSKEQVIDFFNKLLRSEHKNYWMNAAFPKEKALVQGEFYFSERGPYFHCSFVRDKHLRDALDESKEHIYGLRALMILKQFLSASSYSDFEEIIELFPNSVIELSVYDINVGENNYRNTIFWEVRDY